MRFTTLLAAGAMVGLASLMTPAAETVPVPIVRPQDPAPPRDAGAPRDASPADRRSAALDRGGARPRPPDSFIWLQDRLLTYGFFL